MYRKVQSSAYSDSGICRYFFICLLFIWSSSASLQVLSNQDEVPFAFHKLATRVFPELDTVIIEVLEGTNPENSESVLSQAAAQAYRTWHARVQEIKNSPVPSGAALLVSQLLPDGFERTLKGHIFKEPEIETYLRTDLVLYYFLQIVGTAIKNNSALLPIQTELIELFECNNKHCEIQAGITEKDDTPMTLSDEKKRQIFNECLMIQNSLAGRMKEEFCDTFLIWTIM